MPEVGRFISPDPVMPVDPWTSRTNYEMLTNPQRLNPYSYGLNNPYRYVDLDGNIPIDTIWDIGNIVYDIYILLISYSVNPTNTLNYYHWIPRQIIVYNMLN